MGRTRTGCQRLSTPSLLMAVLQHLRSETLRPRDPSNIPSVPQIYHALPAHALLPDAYLVHLGSYPTSAAPQPVLPFPGGRTGHGRILE